MSCEKQPSSTDPSGPPESPERRDFLKRMGLAATGAAIACPQLAMGEQDSGGGHGGGPSDPIGVLVDLSACVGCRLCEYACKKANGLEAGAVESYDDQSVFEQMRRPAPDAFTVVNAWDSADDGQSPVYAKLNCMHCNYPACVSACIVGALRKQDNGAVTYDAWKCIGCRYCMVACPFQLPAYSYDDALTPQVMKCQFCFGRTSDDQLPACVEACPRQAMSFGRRDDLLTLAHERIGQHPDRYVAHVYGEHEIGGTSWLYLSPVPFEQVGFQPLGDKAPPALTETIQHSVFKFGLPPLMVYGVLGAAMFLTRPRPSHGDRSNALARATDRRGERANPGSPNAGEPMLDVAPADARRHGRAHAGRRAGPRDPGADESMLSVAASDAMDLVEPEIHVAEPREVAHEAHDHEPAPVRRKFFTPGVFVLIGLAAIGMGFVAYRFIFGLGASTNLNQQFPWGIWIAIDVASGVALAAGGFTAAALAHVFHRHHYHAIARPALLTAMLGYTFVSLGLQADLGRYYNVWHPMIMWQGNSVLFEVGLCVMAYLTVLYLEFTPIACERLMTLTDRFPRISRLAAFVRSKVMRVMFLLVIAGCVLSCLHQSSLGNLMVIAPYKLHPLWWSPGLALLFLLSAIAVGFPMVIWESLFASWSLKLKPEMNVLGPLARYVPILLGLYLAVKLGDMIWRGTYVHLVEMSPQSICWLIEVIVGVMIPIAMMLSRRVRQSPRLLFTAATLIVLGVMFNRVNVFLVGYSPPFAEGSYFPALAEIAVTVGLIATLMLCYRALVTYLPIISVPRTK